MNRYFVGIDLGSSFVKVSLLDADLGREVAFSSNPPEEMTIHSGQKGWAEQDPEVWWSMVQDGIHHVLQTSGIDPLEIESFGISAQMHGLVAIDGQGNVVRPSIIWCDGRAVSIGEDALLKLGSAWCNTHLLNAPGNFTASKLEWVRANEPDEFKRIDKILLPSDFIAFKLTGEITTTACSLSEGMLWDFKEDRPAYGVLDLWGMEHSLIAELVPAIGFQGAVSKEVATTFGIRDSTTVSFRCGDQPNNAFSLNVTEVGDIAVTAGTSAVLYALTGKPAADAYNRVNTFLHPTKATESPVQGVLACLNGGGKWHHWLKNVLSGPVTASSQMASSSQFYEHMDNLAQSVPSGSDGLMVFPFGNGPERLLNNRNEGAQIAGIQFNTHQAGHLVRAGMEGVAYSLCLGLEVLGELGISPAKMRAGLNNMFLSPFFQHIFVNTCKTSLSLYETNGAEGAARGAALGAGYYSSEKEAAEKLKPVRTVEPDHAKADEVADHFGKWKSHLAAAHF
ncbi:carbohydrate kinase [bacterium]|nr:carbohydrate kinase [bacterium]